MEIQRHQRIALSKLHTHSLINDPDSKENVGFLWDYLNVRDPERETLLA